MDPGSAARHAARFAALSKWYWNGIEEFTDSVAAAPSQGGRRTAPTPTLYKVLKSSSVGLLANRRLGQKIHVRLRRKRGSYGTEGNGSTDCHRMPAAAHEFGARKGLLDKMGQRIEIWPLVCFLNSGSGRPTRLMRPPVFSISWRARRTVESSLQTRQLPSRAGRKRK